MSAPGPSPRPSPPSAGEGGPAKRVGEGLSTDPLSLTYATLRFVQLGWRVIRLEATPAGPGTRPGDPNR